MKLDDLILRFKTDITFEEAFEMTRKHVCITVSASRASSGSGVQRLLLNHISTPNVTLASAVATSCAVPGIMAPRKLMMKDRMGNLTAFEVDGVEWIDGSVQADLPFKRISTLFNISNFVVAQTNFHVAPFLNKAHHPGINTLYWKLFQMCMWDARSRVMNLSQLGLFPRFFGQDLSKVSCSEYKKPHCSFSRRESGISDATVFALVFDSLTFVQLECPVDCDRILSALFASSFFETSEIVYAHSNIF